MAQRPAKISHGFMFLGKKLFRGGSVVTKNRTFEYMTVGRVKFKYASAVV